MTEPRWALWNNDSGTWDEVPAENQPGEWLGGHAYGGDVRSADVRADALDHHAGWCSCVARGWLPRTPPVVETLLRAWAGVAQRLLRTAPTSTVFEEVGMAPRGHATPPERAVIRAEASRIVDGWLARDLELTRRVILDERYVNLVRDWALVCDAVGAAGDDSPDEVIARIRSGGLLAGVTYLDPCPVCGRTPNARMRKTLAEQPR